MANFKRLALGAPVPIAGSGSSWSVSNFTIDQTTDKVGFFWQAPEAITITKLGFRYGARTGTPVEHKIGLQSPAAASGFPDGTFLGGGTPASASFTPPADATWNGTWQWITLDNAYTCTRGQELCIVIEPVGTPDGSNNSSFTYEATQTGWQITRPYGLTNAAGTWSKNAGLPVFGLQSASLTYGYPIESPFITTVNSTAEQALRFSLSASFVSTYTVVGVRFSFRTPASGSTLVVSLYSGTTVLQTVTIDTDFNEQANSSARVGEIYFTDTSLVSLTGGNVYRIGFAPAGTVFGLWGYTADAAGDLSAWPGGTDWFLSTRASGGATAWTDDQTTRPVAEIIIDDWTVAAGGGTRYMMML